ncbi:GntR family transcriptional regulator [Rhodoligotrophos defluvii]|uniref:GntR family transcriptional regulator n=1 Tax=Rhodoligotrophos defluvii TaxID=2561934 RepID=UPI00195FB9B5|nr:GntR family transcriptional regulator [Rhodoligotrophos defluvii]
MSRSHAIPKLAPVAPEETARTLGEIAYDRIKEKIIRCEFEPGAAITEAQLALQIGLGKAPIRRALSRLVQDGFVKSLPRKGYVVAPITLRDVHQLFEIRLLLEPAAARKAAGKIDPKRIQELERICQAGYVPGDRASESAFLEANKDFHIAVVDGAGNQKLTRILSHILEEMSRLFHLGLALRNRTDEMKHEHRELIDALVAGDGETAEKVTIAQIEAARRMVLDAILASSNFQSVEIQIGG